MTWTIAPLLSTLADTVRSTPDVVVVADGEEELTAEQLWRRAGGVARAVRAAEPDRGRPVPVLVGNDVGAVVAMFGVVLSGRPIVPIERTDPVERIAHVVTRVGARTVVVPEEASASLVPDGVHVVVVGHTTPEAVEPLEVDPEELAAVVFTSGSTGRPKGVRYLHTHLARQVEGALATLPFMPDTSPGVIPLSFVAGIIQLVLIASGRRIELRSLARMDPAELVEWVDGERFAGIGVVPSYARTAFARLGPDVRLPHLGFVGTFGEGLHWSDVALLRRLAPNAAIVVTYGASEAGGIGAILTLDPSDPIPESGSVPLGVPSLETSIELEPLQGVDDVDGVEGAREIVFYGNVAAGYWDDPELEAARFGTAPDGRRFWRSADLGEWVDGQLYHRGRADDMIKIGGRLVEPAEPERVLRSIPGVRNAVVLPHRMGSHERLVAHVEVDDHVRPEQVRDTLLRELPPALWPSMLVRHDQIPTTDRGKADRVALREAELRPWRAGSWIPPGTPAEVEVLAAVREVLGLDDVEAIGADDDLLTCGLDSLGLVELIDVLDERDLTGLTIDDVVEARTARDLAVRVERVADGRGTVIFNQEGSQAPLWVMAPPATTAMRFRWLADVLGPDQPVVVFEAPGLHDQRPPVRSVVEAARIHVHELRRLRSTTFAGTPNGPAVVVGYSLGGVLAHEVVGQLRDSGEVAHLVQLDSVTFHLDLVRQVRRRLGDVRRLAWRTPSTTPEQIRALNADLDFWDAYDAVRRTRSPLDLLARRTFGRSLVAEPGRPPRAPAPDHYVRFRADGVEQALSYRFRRPVRPDLFIASAGSGAALDWEVVGGPIELVEVAASHSGMLRPPAVLEVADLLRDWLRRTIPALAPGAPADPTDPTTPAAPAVDPDASTPSPARA